jgi:hypothetical protein
MKHYLLALAGAAALTSAGVAMAQSSMDSQFHGSAAGRYGPSEEVRAPSPASDPVANTRYVSPNDPRYSFTEPPHRGEPSALEMNGDDGGRGTSYAHIIGHEGGQ